MHLSSPDALANPYRKQPHPYLYSYSPSHLTPRPSFLPSIVLLLYYTPMQTHALPKAGLYYGIYISISISIRTQSIYSGHVGTLLTCRLN